MRSLRPKMRRRLPAFLTLASIALAGVGLVGCSSEGASPMSTPFEFTAADRRFYCSAWPVEESVSTTCVTTVGDVALNYYLHRDGRDSAAEQQRMEDIGAELAPALQDLD